MILGIGTDLVQVSRIRRIILRSPRFAGRVYHAEELREANGDEQRLAARFAAKEAWLKAMGQPLFAVALTDVFVTIDDSGRPKLNTTGKAARLAAQRKVNKTFLSLTHEDDFALAFVVLEGENP